MLNECFERRLFRWDPVKRTWEYVAAMPYKRMLSSAAVLNDTLYVVGGRDEFAALDTVISYNTTTNKWKRCASMKDKRNYVGVSGIYLNSSRMPIHLE